MADKPVTPGQSPDQLSSREIAGAGRDIAAQLDELFNDPDSGAYVQGVVVAVEQAEKREGTNDKGRKYSFCNRRIQLQTKAGAIICAESHDDMSQFQPITLYRRVKWAIERARMDGSQMVFNVSVL